MRCLLPEQELHNQVVDTLLEMVRQLVRDIRVRRLVLAHQDQALKVVRCLYIDVFLKEDLFGVFLTSNHLTGSTKSFDSFFCTRTKCICLYCEFLSEFTIAKNFHAIFWIFHNADFY